MVDLVNFFVEPGQMDAHDSTAGVDVENLSELLLEFLEIEQKTLRVVLLIESAFKRGNFIEIQFEGPDQPLGVVFVPVFDVEVHHE